MDYSDDDNEDDEADDNDGSDDNVERVERMYVPADLLGAKGLATIARGLAARESGGVAGVARAAEDRGVRVAAVVGLEYRVRSDERRRVGGGAGRVVDGGAARAHGRIVTACVEINQCVGCTR